MQVLQEWLLCIKHGFLGPLLKFYFLPLWLLSKRDIQALESRPLLSVCLLLACPRTTTSPDKRVNRGHWRGERVIVVGKSLCMYPLVGKTTEVNHIKSPWARLSLITPFTLLMYERVSSVSSFRATMIGLIEVRICSWKSRKSSS